MMFVVDANVLSELAKPAPSAVVSSWLRAQPLIEVSAITVLELEFGVCRLPQGRRRDTLLQWLEPLLAPESVKIIPVDAAIARAAGRLKARAEAAGRMRTNADLIVAATALVDGATVAT